LWTHTSAGTCQILFLSFVEGLAHWEGHQPCEELWAFVPFSILGQARGVGDLLPRSSLGYPFRNPALLKTAPAVAFPPPSVATLDHGDTSSPEDFGVDVFHPLLSACVSALASGSKAGSPLGVFFLVKGSVSVVFTFSTCLCSFYRRFLSISPPHAFEGRLSTSFLCSPAPLTFQV